MIYESRHPLVRHKLARLRETTTEPAEFRALVRNLATLLAYEATTDIPTRSVTVKTPLAVTEAQRLDGLLGIIPILRAGLGMAEGVLELIPDAEIRHLGLFRDEHTLLPKEYYNKMPKHSNIKVALVVDPMLATGGSAVRVCEVLRDCGIPRIKFLGLIAAPEGIERLQSAMPEVDIHVACIDKCLNEVGFIVPGLGDAGDRQFATH